MKMSQNIQRVIREFKAARTIQKLYRGHKDREYAYLTVGLISTESERKPLIVAIKAKEQSYNEAAKKHQVKMKKHEDLQIELQTLEKELEVTRMTKATFLDSTILTGAPQRIAKGVVMVSRKYQFSPIFTFDKFLIMSFKRQQSQQGCVKRRMKYIKLL